MKKGIVILSLIAGIALSAFALFKILTHKNDGTITETNPEIPGSEVEETRAQGSEETGEGGNQKKD